MFGYVYFDDGSWVARKPKGFDVLDKVTVLRSTMTEDGKPAWKSCLIQIKRSEMDMAVDFEYEDADRWRIDPGNLEQMVETLRPS